MKLFLIDGHALIFKMYYAFLGRPMINAKGVDTSILFGFTKYLLELIRREQPTHIAVGFDPPGGTFRNQLYPEYKANRGETPQLVIDALEPLTQIVKSLNIPVLMIPGYEADDVLGSMAKRSAREGFDVYMVTPDKDYGQLLEPHIFQVKPGKKGGDDELFDIPRLLEKYGISRPDQIIDMLAICGDASDNVPGVKGVGEVGASKLLQKYDTLEGIYEHLGELTARQQELFRAAEDHIALSKTLVTIKTDIPIDTSADDMALRPAGPSAIELFNLYGFNSLKKYLGGASGEAVPSEPVRGSAAHPSQPGGWAPPSNGAEGGTPLGGSASTAEAWGNFLRIRGGSVVQSLNLGFKARIEETQASVLSTFVAEIESKFGSLSREIIVPFLPDVDIPGVKFTVPERGDKLSLLELSAKNAREYRAGTLRQREHTDPDAYRTAVLTELQKALGMPVLPEHMECFDNSNIQGTNPVASCVVFRGGVPSKKDYRRFKIKTVVGANDYASMKEVVNRRYSRMLEEAPDDLPQLVVIDGGKGQLEFAWQALCELGIQDRLTVVGLAKRLEEVIRVGDPYPLFLDRNSQALKVLQQIRDEAHRFGITFHRNLRSKAAVKSALDDIPGVGPKTAERLLLHYGSVARIAAADPQDLINFAGPVLAERIRRALAPELFDNDERKDI